MPPLLGIRYPFGDGVRAADGGRGVNIPGETEGQSEVFRVWQENGDRVASGASADIE